MKQVYLVFASISCKDGKRSRVVLNVFSSFRKASDYVNYKSLMLERVGASTLFGSFVDSASIDVETWSICGYDFSRELKVLQDEIR